MNEADKGIIERLEARLAVLEKHGASSATFDGMSLVSVTFHPPAGPALASALTWPEPERTEEAPPSPVTSAALALAGRGKRPPVKEED